ncbi:hypothetical protein GQ457_17G008360 [Hibiscus cannabinus]
MTTPHLFLILSRVFLGEGGYQFLQSSQLSLTTFNSIAPISSTADPWLTPPSPPCPSTSRESNHVNHSQNGVAQCRGGAFEGSGETQTFFPRFSSDSGHPLLPFEQPLTDLSSPCRGEQNPHLRSSVRRRIEPRRSYVKVGDFLRFR